MEGQVCIRCNEFKLYHHFPKHKSWTSGYSTACKDCINKRRLEKLEIFKQTNSALEASLDEIAQKGAEEILTNLGYELYNHENPVYFQFEERMRDKYGIDLSTTKKGSK